VSTARGAGVILRGSLTRSWRFVLGTGVRSFLWSLALGFAVPCNLTNDVCTKASPFREYPAHEAMAMRCTSKSKCGPVCSVFFSAHRKVETHRTVPDLVVRSVHEEGDTHGVEPYGGVVVVRSQPQEDELSSARPTLGEHTQGEDESILFFI
jgi:hypothetical protein